MADFTEEGFEKALVEWAKKTEIEVRKSISYKPESYNIELMWGKRYVRVVKNDGVQKSAFAFIDRLNGDILMAASWNAPAKHPRGNIFQSGGMSHVPYLKQRVVERMGIVAAQELIKVAKQVLGTWGQSIEGETTTNSIRSGLRTTQVAFYIEYPLYATDAYDFVKQIDENTRKLSQHLLKFNGEISKLAGYKELLTDTNPVVKVGSRTNTIRIEITTAFNCAENNDDMRFYTIMGKFGVTGIRGKD